MQHFPEPFKLFAAKNSRARCTAVSAMSERG